MAPSAVHLLMALLKAVAAVVPSAILLLLAVAVQQRAMAFHGSHFSFWGAAILNVRGTGNACEGPRGEWGLGHERFVRPMAEVLGPNGHGQRHTHTEARLFVLFRPWNPIFLLVETAAHR